MTNAKTFLFSFCLSFLIYYTSAAYDPAQGLEYVYAASLSYCNPDHVQSWTCGAACQNLTGYQAYYSNVFKIAADETLAFSMIVNPTSKRFITAFRGTVGNIELFSEILQESPVPYQLTNVPNAEVLGFFYNHYVNDLRTTVVQKLQDASTSYPDYTFIFTGHSLGAALTTLVAFDTVTSGAIPKEQVLLYNYGSPRVGNYAFAQAVMAALPAIYRVTHWNDLAPHVPPCVTDSSGQCVNDLKLTVGVSGLIWPAWHVSEEIFYDKPCDNFQACGEDEDPQCADQFKLVDTTMAQHYYYLTVPMECDGNYVIVNSKLEDQRTPEETKFEAEFIGWV